MAIKIERKSSPLLGYESVKKSDMRKLTRLMRACEQDYVLIVSESDRIASALNALRPRK